MTRSELITLLETNPQSSREIDFWCWWYGCSTEADKPNPLPPDEDYVKDKISYNWTFRPTESIDDAIRLIPIQAIWTIEKGIAWVRLLTKDDVATFEHHQHGRTALSICIASLKARQQT